MEYTTDGENVALVQHQICPSCKASLEFDPRYPVWCECGWNLQPQQVQPRNFFEQIYAAVGAKAGHALLSEVLNAKSIRPTLTASILLAFLIALLVYGFVLALALLGSVIIIRGWPGLFPLVVGVALLAVAWFFRPQFPRMPKSILARETFSALYALVDRVAESLGSPRVDGIVITGDYNAAFSRAGWRRKRIMYFGLPLWSTLKPQERIAIIGHELGHNINGDWLRGFFVGGAVSILLTLYELLDPTKAAPRYRRRVGFGYDLGILILYPVRLIVKAVAFMLASLLWRSSQRAEYLADYLGATASGSEAALSALDKLHFGRNFSVTVDVILNKKQGAFLAEFQQRFAGMPAREMERMRRVERLAGTQLDATHPPTAYRIEFLSKQWLESRIVLSQSESDRIDHELASLEPEIERQIAYRFGRNVMPVRARPAQRESR